MHNIKIRVIPTRTHISSSTKRIFLFSASMAFISSAVSEKSNICIKVRYGILFYFIILLWIWGWHPSEINFNVCTEHFIHQQRKKSVNINKPTWKLCLILSGLKLFGITTTPLWTLNRRATWALLLLYFFPMDTSSSSSSRGGHFTFTLSHTHKRLLMMGRDSARFTSCMEVIITTTLQCHFFSFWRILCKFVKFWSLWVQIYCSLFVL